MTDIAAQKRNEVSGGRRMYSTLWEDGRYSFGAGVETSSIRMVFIHSAVMVSRSTIDMPA